MKKIFEALVGAFRYSAIILLPIIGYLLGKYPLHQMSERTINLLVVALICGAFIIGMIEVVRRSWQDPHDRQQFLLMTYLPVAFFATALLVGHTL